jgi:hypothetical protein
MPIALINASGRATHAHASLCETHATMTGHVVAEASITIPLTDAAWDADGNFSDPRFSTMLKSAIDALAQATRERPAV